MPIGHGGSKYWPALDGLRAFAVGAVLLYHGGQRWILGGFLGVDAFFVLSGFLITTLLVSERVRTGTITFGAFWIRRARRLLPALFLVIGAVAIYAAFVAAPTQLTQIRGDAFASLGYVANWRFVLSGESYFDQFTTPSPLRHLWSLAIEEQFYFVWPVVVWAVMRRRASLNRLLGITIGLVAASSVLMVVLFREGADPSRVYYGTDTRAQSVLVGAVVAILLASTGPARSAPVRLALRVGAAVGVAYTIWAWSQLDEQSTWLYRGGFLTGAIAVALVIASVVQTDPGVLGRAMSWRPLRWVGQISYGLYLWHWPLFLVLTRDRLGLEDPALLVVRLAATFALATLSYYAVEMPIRRGALRQWRGRVAIPAALAIVIVAIVFSTVGGRPSFADLATNSAARAPAVVKQADAASAEPVRVLIVGDSVAFTLGLGLSTTQAEDGLAIWNQGRLGCSLQRRGDPIIGSQPTTRNPDGWGGLPYCDWATEWPPLLDEIDPEVVLFLYGAWDILDYTVDGRVLSLGTPERDAMILSELDAAADLLTERGARLALATVPYFTRPNVDTQTVWTEFQPWRVDHLNALYRQWARSNASRATLVDLNRQVSPKGEFADVIDGILVRDDGVHFTIAGAAWVSKWLHPKLREIDNEGRVEAGRASG